MITKRLIPLLILIGCLVAHVALGGYTLAVSHEEILKSAKDAVKAFEEALQSGDPQKIQSAVHRIKSNPKAIELLEQNPVLKQRFNTTLKIASTKTGVGNVIAKTEKTNLRRIEPELLTQTSDPSGIDRSVKKNSPRQIPENSNVRVSLSDFMEQDHTSQKLTESKAEQIGREMSELRRPTYRSLPDNSQKPLEPTESAWTDVMRTFRGETEIKSSPKLAKDPEGAQYVDPKNKYIAADKVHDAPSLAEIKREAKMRMQTKAGRDSAFRGARRHAADYDVREFGVESAKGSNQQKIADLVYAYKRLGIRTSENEITRIAINFVVSDHKENGENSVLDLVLIALNK